VPDADKCTLHSIYNCSTYMWRLVLCILHILNAVFGQSGRGCCTEYEYCINMVARIIHTCYSYVGRMAGVKLHCMSAALEYMHASPHTCPISVGRVAVVK